MNLADKTSIKQFYMDIFQIYNNELLDKLIMISNYEKIPKKKDLFNIGEYYLSYFFCYDACVKTIKIKTNGEYNIDSFIFQIGMPVIEIDAINQNKKLKCRFLYTTIKNSNFIVVNIEKFNQLLYEYEELNNYYKKVIYTYLKMYQLNSKIKNLDAIEKVNYFKKNYDDVINYLSSEEISNFLGINKTTYLKINNKNYKKRNPD